MTPKGDKGDDSQVDGPGPQAGGGGPHFPGNSGSPHIPGTGNGENPYRQW